MKSEAQQVFEFALGALQAGRRVCLVSVVETFGSSPRPVGSMLVVDSVGHFVGSVSGGCIEEDLIETLAANIPSAPELRIYGDNEAERTRLQLPCGGHLRLLLEEICNTALLEDLLQALSQRKNLQWQCDIKTGQQCFFEADEVAKTELTKSCWLNTLGPKWRMFIIGAGPIANYLVDMANSINVSCLVIDPRPEYHQDWDLNLAPLQASYPDDVLLSAGLDDHSLVIALSHDPKLDDLGIMVALNSPAKYIGAMGSAKTSANRRQRLKQHFDFTELQLRKLKAPIGLDIGSKTPAEIAVSILADVIAVKNGKAAVVVQGGDNA